MKTPFLICCILILALTGLSCTAEPAWDISITETDAEIVVENTGSADCIVIVRSPDGEQRFELAVGKTATLDIPQPVEVSAVSLSTEKAETPWILKHGASVGGLAAAAILLVALVVAILQLRHMRHERVTSLVLSLSQAYDSGVFFEGRKLRERILREQERLGIKNKQRSFVNTMNYYQRHYTQEYMTLISVPSFWDMVGSLVRNRCCDINMIDEQLAVRVHYELWEPYIREFQEKKPEEPLDDKPTAYFGNFVWLVNELPPEEQQDDT